MFATVVLLDSETPRPTGINLANQTMALKAPGQVNKFPSARGPMGVIVGLWGSLIPNRLRTTLDGVPWQNCDGLS
jgi:hypothetical protein